MAQFAKRAGGISLIILTCENPACSQEFTKPLAEFKRSEKLGRQHFCCLKCFAQCKGIQNFQGKININTEHLPKGSDRWKIQQALIKD